MFQRCFHSGFSIFVQSGRLVFDYNSFGDHQIVESTVEVPVGASAVGVEFRRAGGGGVASLVIDDRVVGSVEIPYVMSVISSIGPSVGFDHGSPVSRRYDHEFPFAGTIERVDIQLLNRSEAEAADTARAAERAAMAQQ